MLLRSRFTRALLLPAAVAIAAPSAAVAQPGGSQGSTTVNVPTDPLLRAFRWRSIGPSGMGGRVDDIEVSETNPYIIYVGYATGGLTKSTNNGVTWTHVFQTYPTASIGDIAIHPTNPDIVYVGTGEANNRQTSSFGDGMYKTTDGGRTFTNIGLRETQSIARVVIDRTNPEIVYVAAVGHLFGPNRERGIFKTTDGGRTWSNVKFIDENTGFTDLVMDPRDSRTLYAASYQRRRTAFGFSGGGPGSAIWKTTDAGATWTKLTGNGLPPGTMGRVALDVSRSNPNVVYAQIEVDDLTQPAPARGGGGGGGGAAGGGGRGGPPPAPDPTRSGVWRSENKGQSWTFMSNNNNRPMYFSQIRIDPTNDQNIWTAGLPVSLSKDGGKTFRPLDGQGHVDQHAIWIDPKNGSHVMTGNDGGMDVTYDQGESWESLRTEAMGLFYQVSVDMRRPYWVCGGLQDNGSWCGPSALRSSSANPILGSDWYNIGGGDGFWTQIDPFDWATVYSESQNGNMGRYDLRTGRRVSIRPTPPTPPTPAGGAGGRGGGAGAGGGGGAGPGAVATTNIVGAPADLGPLTFHWNTPIILSPHNSQVVYTGSNRFHRSNDRGTTWTASAILSRNINRDTLSIMGVRGSERMMSKNDGVNGWGLVFTISESPSSPGVIWVGTDDGNIQLSRDGGTTFTEVGKNMAGAPKNYYVSRVEASYFDPGTAFVTLDGHRNDDMKPYVYMTRDFGQTWQSITNNLPAFGCVNVIKQDRRNRNLLYVGTEYGFYASTDEGRTWTPFMPNLPTVRVDDVVIHPRDGDLVLATHGRSVWIMDDVTSLQQLTPAIQAADAHLFDIRPGIAWHTDVRYSREITGAKNFTGENAPRGTSIQYYLKSAPSGDIRLTVANMSGTVVRTLQPTRYAGINRVQWNLAADPPPAQGGAGGGGAAGGGGGGGRGGGPPGLAAGSYIVTLTVNGRSMSKPVSILEDIWMHER